MSYSTQVARGQLGKWEVTEAFALLHLHSFQYILPGHQNEWAGPDALASGPLTIVSDGLEEAICLSGFTLFRAIEGLSPSGLAVYALV